MPVIHTQILCVPFVIFHVAVFVISYVMYFLLFSCAVSVIGLMATTTTTTTTIIIIIISYHTVF